jgi:hypothetical protein
MTHGPPVAKWSIRRFSGPFAVLFWFALKICRPVIFFLLMLLFGFYLKPRRCRPPRVGHVLAG